MTISANSIRSSALDNLSDAYDNVMRLVKCAGSHSEMIERLTHIAVVIDVATDLLHMTDFNDD